MNKWYFILFALLLSSCYRVPRGIDPVVDYTVQERYLKKLPASFPPLSPAEKREDWGKEYLIGLFFAKELDLYQAITAFKRAEFLIPSSEKQRKLEIQYEIILCYFLGQKYEEVLSSFKASDLKFIDSSFPAYNDLLIILYESYQKVGDPQSAQQMLENLRYSSPEEADKLALSHAISTADFCSLRPYAATPSSPPYLKQMLNCYDNCKKSVSVAQGLNALLPGAGFLYIGQKQSALTAFLLNGLFIFATYEFFHHNFIAAGIITASFEAGWYFGGIYGGGEEAKFYNERLYEREAYNVLNRERLFPVLLLKYGF